MIVPVQSRRFAPRRSLRDIVWSLPLLDFVAEGGSGGSHRAETAAFGLAMCRWSSALQSTIRAGASSARRGIETDADSPATNTVSNRATALVSQALLGRYDHVEAVGRGGVIDQGGTFCCR